MKKMISGNPITKNTVKNCWLVAEPFTNKLVKLFLMEVFIVFFCGVYRPAPGF